MKSEYLVAVRTLCEFTAKSGDLSARFSPSPTSQQGIFGHALLAARRGPDYRRELSLTGRHESLTVRGRADGYDEKRNLLEEFKTYRGDLACMPSNQRGLHWAQLKIYGALLCAERGMTEIELALVYLDIKTEKESILAERWSAEHLLQHFAHHCGLFLSWARRELAHRAQRDACLATLIFPHAHMRAGQRQMAEAIYLAALRGRSLMVQAPTGIGKTLGSLFPLLKAAPKKKLDKIFFLVAKTPGRLLALDALRLILSTNGMKALRVLEMVAKAGACQYPGRACDADSCPLARGFYDRLPQARSEALDAGVLDQTAVLRAALANHVCPYFLGLELARWCDVIIGDYNYFFDSHAALHALSVQNAWRIAVLVDEAHNLVPRGRDMYSATLEPAALDAALEDAPASVRGPLQLVRRSWRALACVQTTDYAVLECIPQAFVAALQQATAAIGEDIALDPIGRREALMRFYFDALHFCKMAENFGAHSLFDVNEHGRLLTLCIRNIDPSGFLRPRFAACVAAVLFSATLTPRDFYLRLLGMPEGSDWMNVDSPFSGHQLDVRVEPRISTRFRDRGNSVVPIAALIGRQYQGQPGNYLAFFSSFAYLQAVLAAFEQSFPDITVWEQVPAMPAPDRDAFLARFTVSGRGIGFAVLGGAFAEGIDLPGTRLIGAFIATLGLPQVNVVNTEIERRMQTLFNAGYEYTYLYPGLQKVVQAAGRVIRTLTDKGTLYLIDDRYQGAGVRRLLPEWWRVQCV